MIAVKGHRSLLTVITILLISITGYTFHPLAASAQVPHWNNIKVALFIQSNGNIHNAEPTVTLSSSSGLKVGIRHNASAVDFFSTNNSNPMRFSLDDYSVQVIETANQTIAKQLYGDLKNDQIHASIVTEHKKGTAVYQVDAGPFTTAAEAAASLQSWRKRSDLSPWLHQNDTVQIRGPYHLTAGDFSSESQAYARQNELLKAGIDAYMVYSLNSGGAAQYSVWVGEASSSGELQALKTKAAGTVPGIPLQTANENNTYVLEKHEFSAQGSPSVSHFYFRSGQSPLQISRLNSGSDISVAEKDRNYRGDMLIQEYHQKMALLNDVPFEQYLYSVVGSELGGAPMEALKAQAVAARTFALSQGTEYGIANISDTTYDQAYYGVGRETQDSIKAVNATAGQVLVDASGHLITAYYSSNAGGYTASPEEVWGSSKAPYIVSKPSPDQNAADGVPIWLHAVFRNGTIGFIDSDYAQITDQKNAAGLPVYEANGTNVNVRKAPYVDNSTNPPLMKVDTGDRFVVFGSQVENNSYSWARGPYSSAQLQRMMSPYLNSSPQGPIQSVSITKTGPSGRVMQMSVNGQTISVHSLSDYRLMFDHLPSSRFEIENTGRYTIQGANGQTTVHTGGGSQIYVVGAGGESSSTTSNNFQLDEQGTVRLATSNNQFLINGKGFGHGIGLSQWGAMGFAKLGYDYVKILHYYYNGVHIIKD